MRPTIEESPHSTVGVAGDYIFRARLGPHRRQLGVGKRSGKRQQSGGDPDGKHPQWRAYIACHDTRFQEHTGADDVADVDRNSGDWSKTANQLALAGHV